MLTCHPRGLLRAALVICVALPTAIAVAGPAAAAHNTSRSASPTVLANTSDNHNKASKTKVEKVKVEKVKVEKVSKVSKTKADRSGPSAPRAAAPESPSFVGPILSGQSRMVALAAGPMAPVTLAGPYASSEQQVQIATVRTRSPRSAGALDRPVPIRRVAPPRLPALPPLPDLGRYGSVVLPVAGSLLNETARHPGIPLGLITVVLLFVLVQHRIDRRDPKLALVVAAEPMHLPFGGVVRNA